MANLLLDDSGRPKPQYENEAGTAFEALKGADGAMKTRSDDGKHATLGATTDTETANTVIGRLKKLISLIPAALTAAGNLKVSVQEAIPAGTNNIGDVDVLTLPALPAGTNNIGDVDIVSISAGADPHAVSTWLVTITADNVEATVTKAAETGKSHYITSISGSFSAALIKLMTLKDGATVIGNYHVHNQRDIIFQKPVKITAGNAVELSLAASGTAGTIGAVTMTGYTI